MINYRLMAFWTRLRRNYLWKLFAEGSRGFTVLYFAFLARWLGAETLGVFSVGYAAAMILGALADMGLNTLLTRTVARDRGLGAVRFLQTAYVKAAAFGLAAAAVLLAPLEGRRLLWLLFIGIAATRNLLDQVSAFCLAHERLDVEARLKFVWSVSVLGLGAAGALTAPRAETAAALMLAAQALALAVGLWLVSEKVAPLPLPSAWPRPQWPAEGRREIVALALVGVTMNAFSRMDIYALRFFGVPNSSIGHYFAAERVIAALCLLPGLLAVAAFPVLSDLSARAPQEVRRSERKLLGVLAGAGAFAGGALAMASGLFVRLMYGPGYADSADILRWLCLAVPFMFVNHMSLNVLIAGGRSWRAALAALAAFSVNLAADLALVPILGTQGAAMAFAAGQASLSLAAAISLWLGGDARRTALPAGRREAFGAAVS